MSRKAVHILLLILGVGISAVWLLSQKVRGLEGNYSKERIDIGRLGSIIEGAEVLIPREASGFEMLKCNNDSIILVLNNNNVAIGLIYKSSCHEISMDSVLFEQVVTGMNASHAAFTNSDYLKPDAIFGHVQWTERMQDWCYIHSKQYTNDNKNMEAFSSFKYQARTLIVGLSPNSFSSLVFKESRRGQISILNKKKYSVVYVGLR